MLIFEVGNVHKNETQYVKVAYCDANGIEFDRDFIRPKFHLEVDDTGTFIDEDFSSGRKHIVNDKEVK